MRKFFEPLEDRCLMSLVVDLRLPGGGKQMTVGAVGDKVDMEIWATATGADATGSNEALQIVDGSILSTNISGGAVNGTLQATPISPWLAPGAQFGSQVDLDGDGDLDVGSNDVSSANGFFFCRADSLQDKDRTNVGVVSGDHQSWQIGTATFTVTSLRNISGSTNIVFRPREYISGALWREDGVNILKNGISGDYLAGSALVIKTSKGGTVSTGGISGQVYTDTDGSGTKNGSETGRSGVIVFLDADKDGVLDAGESNVSTDGSGNYSFSSLSSGSYRVRVVAPSNFHVTAPAAGFTDVSVGSTVATGKNFGVKQDSGTTLGSITGRIFSDNNKNGTFDTGDTLLSNRKMFIDANNNGKLDTGEKTAFSNASGVYTFSSLATGTYHIRRGDLPTGYFNTVPASGQYDIVLSSGQNVSGKDFGAAQGTGGGGSGSISGRIFSDANKDGAFNGGDTLLSARKIYIDANNNGKLDTGEKSTTSNASGVYTFTALAAGTYHLRRADLPTGYFNTVPASGVWDIVLGGGQVITNKDFGAATGTSTGGTATISGKVYNDTNKDGGFDSGESLLSARTMYIDANKNGTLDTGEKKVTSNASGVYTFSGLAAGTYRIRRADLPSNYHLTQPTVGFYDITVVSGQTVSNKDFGAALT